MNKDSIIVKSGNITLMLDSNDGFPAERKEVYLRALCDLLNAVDKDQLWDMYGFIFSEVATAFAKRVQDLAGGQQND